MMLPFYDQPAHTYNVNENYDNFKLFLGFQTCDQPVHPDNVKNDDDDFRRFLGFGRVIFPYFCCETNPIPAAGIDYTYFRYYTFRSIQQFGKGIP